MIGRGRVLRPRGVERVSGGVRAHDRGEGHRRPRREDEDGTRVARSAPPVAFVRRRLALDPILSARLISIHPPSTLPLVPPPSLLHQCDDAIAAARASARRAARDASAARVDVEAAAKDVAAARAALAEAQAVVDDRLAAERRFALRVASLEAEAKRADAIVEAKTREKETSAAEEVRARLAMDAARARAAEASAAVAFPPPALGVALGAPRR